MDDALVKKAMIAAAKQKIVVADASKIGHTMFAAVADLEDIDTLVTSDDAPLDQIQQLEDRGIEVILAGI